MPGIRFKCLIVSWPLTIIIILGVETYLSYLYQNAENEINETDDKSKEPIETENAIRTLNYILVAFNGLIIIGYIVGALILHNRLKYNCDNLYD
jgi:uncharacterized membrane protein YkgB